MGYPEKTTDLPQVTHKLDHMVASLKAYVGDFFLLIVKIIIRYTDCLIKLLTITSCM